MTPAAPIRCVAPHPDGRPGPCNGVLTRAVPGTYVVEPGDNPPPGCFELLCPRSGCGARYVACARAA
jgi:hypothetical protein